MRVTAATLAAALVALAGAPAALSADPPWPMDGHDAARTSRSAVVSAQSPALVPGWPLSEPGVALWLAVQDGPLAVPAGVARTGVLNPDGTVRRLLPMRPAVAAGPDGTLYAWAAEGDRVAAHRPDGRRLWLSEAVDLGPAASDRDLRPAPDGTVYVAGVEGVAALAPGGALRWIQRGAGAPVVGPDGTAYLRVEGDGQAPRVVARRPEGPVLWERPLERPGGPMAATGDGTVLVAQGAGLLALAPDGSERWSAAADSAPSGVAVGADGTAYVVAGRAGPRAALLALGPDGALHWRVDARVAGPPVVGGDGTVYAGGAALLALTPDGRRRWRLDVGRPLAPRAIAGDGALLVDARPPLLGGAYASPALALALAGPGAPRRVRLPAAGRGPLIAGLRLSATRLRTRGPVAVCPVPGGPCRPRTPLGATVRLTVAREAVVTFTVRRAGDGRVAARRVRRVRPGVAWRPLLDVTAWRPLPPGRYTIAARARAAAGPGRATSGPIGFTVVR